MRWLGHPADDCNGDEAAHNALGDVVGGFDTT